ncbi:hypothetical protein RF11_10646 [Thelohanellus kitauei]|uniref:Uncharacterized protein n=1 Tax=Thelohanellus kitauei TaxID=669202 RepID=A0A0C2J2G8_THEKT|nr:hypothetical protein RF11_10646 [Thelohanellus kitauei]
MKSDVYKDRWNSVDLSEFVTMVSHFFVRILSVVIFSMPVDPVPESGSTGELSTLKGTSQHVNGTHVKPRVVYNPSVVDARNEDEMLVPVGSGSIPGVSTVEGSPTSTKDHTVPRHGSSWSDDTKTHKYESMTKEQFDQLLESGDLFRLPFADVVELFKRFRPDVSQRGVSHSS